MSQGWRPAHWINYQILLPGGGRRGAVDAVNFPTVAHQFEPQVDGCGGGAAVNRTGKHGGGIAVDDGVGEAVFIVCEGGLAAGEDVVGPGGGGGDSGGGYVTLLLHAGGGWHGTGQPGLIERFNSCQGVFRVPLAYRGCFGRGRQRRCGCANGARLILHVLVVGPVSTGGQNYHDERQHRL